MLKLKIVLIPNSKSSFVCCILIYFAGIDCYAAVIFIYDFAEQSELRQAHSFEIPDKHCKIILPILCFSHVSLV